MKGLSLENDEDGQKAVKTFIVYVLNIIDKNQEFLRKRLTSSVRVEDKLSFLL